MEQLKVLAAVAATEIRQSPENPGERVRALVDYFNHVVVKSVLQDKDTLLDPLYWLKIGRAMSESIKEDEIEIWVAALGGQMSLYLLPEQRQIPRKDLARNVLNFCDAIDIVGLHEPPTCSPDGGLLRPPFCFFHTVGIMHRYERTSRRRKRTRP